MEVVVKVNNSIIRKVKRRARPPTWGGGGGGREDEEGVGGRGKRVLIKPSFISPLKLAWPSLKAPNSCSAWMDLVPVLIKV